jgi:hypothetical protein
MKMVMTDSEKETEPIPVYCKDCGGVKSWRRQPARDIKSESGKVMWKRWECTNCGAETIYPANSANSPICK